MKKDKPKKGKGVTLADFLHFKKDEKEEYKDEEKEKFSVENERKIELKEEIEIEVKPEEEKAKDAHVQTSPRIFTVQELTRYIKQRLDEDNVLRDIHVRGELSNLSQPTSGHLFFTLKDEKSELQCVMFRSKNTSGFIPEEGMKAVLRGYISVYEKRGRYQLYVEEIQEEGIGALYVAFEQLKRKLKEEGLFDVTHKKPIPRFPRRIGIITSPTGAAIRDILNIIRRRFPNVHVLLAPVAVQGDEAIPQIVNAIQLMNRVSDKQEQMKMDVLIVGRGGGSLEELWAFNEEEIARAIFSSVIPIISAVGHEIDFTIADFVADKRAATPSEAAEIVVPDKREIMVHLKTLETRIQQNVLKFIEWQRKRLENVEKSIVFRRPEERINQQREALDEIKRKLYAELSHRVALQKEKLKTFTGKLDVLSPLAMMERGYAICSRIPEGTTIKSVEDIEVGDRIKMILKDGKAVSEVKEKERRKEELL